MAAIEPAAPKTGTKPRVRKHSFRLDMTPMVDLAFLLLTFFMLTTTFARPRVLELQMPVRQDKVETPLKHSRAMTILLAPGRKVYYYFGLSRPGDPTVSVPTLHITNFGPHGIRQALFARQQQSPAPFVLIKLLPRTDYQSMVNILDEMNLTDQKQYTITDLTAADRQLLPVTERQ